MTFAALRGPAMATVAEVVVLATLRSSCRHCRRRIARHELPRCPFCGCPQGRPLNAPTPAGAS